MILDQALPEFRSKHRANIGPNRFHQNRTLSWQMSIPRSNSRSSACFLELNRSDTEAWAELVEKYRLIETQQEGLTAADAARAASSRSFDLTQRREKRVFSRLTLVAEIARYLNLSPSDIEDLLETTKVR
jgi:hypothetical protein